MERGYKFGRLEVLAFSLLAAASFLYIFLAYTTHISLSQSSTEESLLLRLTIAIPEIIIWTIATLSAVSFKKYASSIRQSKDGQGLNLIADALIWLVVYVVLLTMGDSVVRLFANSPHLKTAVVLGNHIPLVAIVISSIVLYKGSRILCGLTKGRIWSANRALIFSLVIVVLSIFFTWRFYQSAPLVKPVAGVPRFALSVDVLLFSYVLPHLIVWVLGSMSIINLAFYAAKTPGKIYRTLFHSLYRGLLLVFVCIFIAQLIIISNVDLTRFNPLVAIIYLVLLLATVGFVLVSRGTQELYKIETLHKLNLGLQKTTG